MKSSRSDARFGRSTAEVRTLPSKPATAMLYSTRFSTNGSTMAWLSSLKIGGSTARSSSTVATLATPIEEPRWAGFTITGKASAFVSSASAASEGSMPVAGRSITSHGSSGMRVSASRRLVAALSISTAEARVRMPV